MRTEDGLKEGVTLLYLKARRMQTNSRANMHSWLWARSFVPEIPTLTYLPAKLGFSRRCHLARICQSSGLSLDFSRGNFEKSIFTVFAGSSSFK